MRIMISTCKWTTFLQYCARDMDQGFKANGHETRFLIEDNDVQSLCPQFYLKEVAEFKPDLFFTVSHCRASYPFMPKELPFISFIQDKLPILMQIQDLRPYIQPHDLFVCSMNEFKRYMMSKKVPEEQIVIIPPPANPKEFYSMGQDGSERAIMGQNNSQGFTESRPSSVKGFPFAGRWHKHTVKANCEERNMSWLR